MNIRRLSTRAPDFTEALNALLMREVAQAEGVREQVAHVIAEVRKRGIAAVLDFTRRWDGWQATEERIMLSRAQLAKAWEELDAGDREALELAAARVRAYHERQKRSDWRFTDETGCELGMRFLPLDAVGLYAPGGKAAYPSSVLMNAIPAQVAGVERIVLVSPAPKGEVNPLVLGAAYLAGVQEAFLVGGAQAIAALAFGAAPIPRVDKIVGPGNAYVAEAKRQVFGVVGIDMIAGPSEVVIVAEEGEPKWLAADMLAQAEHDEDAQSILISTDRALLDAVEQELARLLAELPTAAVARASLARHGALIEVQNWDEAAQIVNRIAPEHLELALADAEGFAAKVRHAGAIFLGVHTPEALGDYLAGPNHVLPTLGTARFSSPLSVDDFVKKTTILRATPKALAALGPFGAHLARREGLIAHAYSLEFRLEGEDKQ